MRRLALMFFIALNLVLVVMAAQQGADSSTSPDPTVDARDDDNR